jgi:geranylgeranylglycerol-phosphate geranylgeranyltransferase
MKLGLSLALIRLHNCLMASLGVAVGRFLMPQDGSSRQHIYAMAAAFFVCGFGNAVNDLLDTEADRINHPGRPLPSGRLSRREAGLIAFIFAVAASALTFPLNGPGRIIVTGALILVTWYNLSLKHTAFWGNIAVSLLAAFTFLLGGAERGFEGVLEFPGPMVAAALAFLMHLIREIVKDIEDQTGDAVTGVRTAAVTYGVRWAVAAVWLVFVLLAAGIIGIYIVGWFDRVYLAVTVILIVIPSAFFLVWMSLKPDRFRCRSVSITFKIQMVVGTVALVVGRGY